MLLPTCEKRNEHIMVKLAHCSYCSTAMNGYGIWAIKDGRSEALSLDSSLSSAVSKRNAYLSAGLLYWSCNDDDLLEWQHTEIAGKLFFTW